MLAVVVALLLLPKVVTGSVGHAPNLDIPAIRPEVGASLPGVRDSRFGPVADAMRVQPVVHQHLKTGPRNVAIVTDPSFALLPSARPDSDAALVRQCVHGSSRNTMHPRDVFEREPAFVERTQFIRCWHDDNSALTAGLPKRWPADVVPLEPVHDGRTIGTVSGSNLLVAKVLDVNKALQFFASGRSDASVYKAAVRGSSGHAVVLHPANYFGFADAELCPDLASRQTVGEVQVFEDLSGWSHVPNIAGAEV